MVIGRVRREIVMVYRKFNGFQGEDEKRREERWCVLMFTLLDKDGG